MLIFLTICLSTAIIMVIKGVHSEMTDDQRGDIGEIFKGSVASVDIPDSYDTSSLTPPALSRDYPHRTGKTE